MAAAGETEAPEGADELGRMRELDLGLGGGPRRDRDEGVGDPGVGDALEHGFEARRALRVAGPGVVLQVARMRLEQDRHASSVVACPLRETRGHYPRAA